MNTEIDLTDYSLVTNLDELEQDDICYVKCYRDRFQHNGFYKILNVNENMDYRIVSSTNPRWENKYKYKYAIHLRTSTIGTFGNFTFSTIDNTCSIYKQKTETETDYVLK